MQARRRTQQIKDGKIKVEQIINTEKGDRVRIIITVGDRQGKLYVYEHKGPFEIVSVHNNGTVTIQCGNFKERINIRRPKRVLNKQITG